MEFVTGAIESVVGLEESFHWLFLRMNVDISRLLATTLAEQLPLLPSISFHFCLGTGPSCSMGTSIDFGPRSFPLQNRGKFFVAG
ncbi:hypothetical protein P8452_77414 [Trifolium repens]|nr:hypothetical protein P8452_77414 [Trifolium repens]